MVLQNVPDKQTTHNVKKLIGINGNLVLDVIEVSRKHIHLDKAVRYFLNDKVVCKDFETAVKLQKQGVKDIITEDGT